MNQESKELLKVFRAQLKTQRRDEALQQIRHALKRGIFDEEALPLLGQAISKSVSKDDQTLKVFIVGQCTTSFLLPILVALAWEEGQALDVRDGNYDNVLQDLLSLDWEPDIVIVIPWNQRLLSHGERDLVERVSEEMAYLSSVWQSVSRLDAKLIQVTYDWIVPGPHGYSFSDRMGGDIAVIRSMNSQLREDLPNGAHLVELEYVSAISGHMHFYDLRNYHWMKQPFSSKGAARLSGHLWAGIRALTQGQKKVLVLDLDNTLWGGIVAETGAAGIDLGETAEGEAYSAFQQFVKQLSRRGILIAVCSKNNAKDAREPFETNQRMSLQLEDIVCFEASWDPKPTAIRRISEELRLGLSSFVFFDDNPAEREHVCQALPEVKVVNVPLDPADYVSALQESLCFEATMLTQADASRTRDYQNERKRLELRDSNDSLTDYLNSLDMTASFSPINESNLNRVTQLVTKTNQFNLTVRRHSVDKLRSLSTTSKALSVTASLQDKFGDYGLISVVIAMPSPDCDKTLKVDTWLMSCRAIGRSVEKFLMNRVVEEAASRGFSRIIGEYVPSPKNQLVESHYEKFGFKEIEQADPSGNRLFEIEIPMFKIEESPITELQPSPHG